MQNDEKKSKQKMTTSSPSNDEFAVSINFGEIENMKFCIPDREYA